MKNYASLPASARALVRRYRLLARESILPNLTGGQLMRRKGQSLDFREYMPYMPGDDIRFVDWRASARYGIETDMLVRSFVAEERLRILISIDPRATMRLPQAMPKLQIAAWLAEALATVAASDDEIYLHWLFTRQPMPPVPFRSAAQLGQIPLIGEDAPANLQYIRPFLPPTAIWLVVSDLYFELNDDATRLASMITAAQNGMCWVLLIDLDSWQHECAVMGNEVWQLARPNITTPSELVQLTPENMSEVTGRITRHRKQFLGMTHLPSEDRLCWQWPSVARIDLDDRERFFNETFTGDGRIKDLFAKQNL